jgi:hypothetical protein
MMHLNKLPNQKRDEKVHLFMRRHWITPLCIILSMIFMYGVPLAIVTYFQDDLMRLLENPLVGPIIVLIGGTYILSVWLFAFLEFTDYYLDVWIVTNRRIINIEQKGLFKRFASELHLSAVQDVTSEVTGIIRTFLDYGNVFVQTAAEHVRFVFKDIKSPEEVKEKVIRLVEDDKRKHRMEAIKDVKNVEEK